MDGLILDLAGERDNGFVRQLTLFQQLRVLSLKTMFHLNCSDFYATLFTVRLNFWSPRVYAKSHWEIHRVKHKSLQLLNSND